MPAPECLDSDVLAAFFNGTLGHRERAAAQQHIEGCLQCRQALDGLQTQEQEPPLFSEEPTRVLRHDTPLGTDATPDSVSKTAVSLTTQATPALPFLDPPRQPGSLGRLGPYEILEVLGQGAVGIVLRGHEPTLARDVAIKMLAPQLVHDPTARRRFAREGRATAALSHPNIVTVHVVEDTGSRPYLVMEYVRGESLQQLLDRAGALPLPQAVRIGAQVAAALAAAHAAGLVHRDVKPGNVLIEADTGRVKLTDFGLVQHEDGGVSQADVLAGTPLYMSPEQAEGRPVTARSDLFSLGSVLYAACAGRSPFAANTPLAVLRRISEAAPVPLSKVKSAVPAWLSQLVAQLHSKEPETRPDAAQVAHVLAERQDDPTLRRRPHRWAIAVILLLSVVGFGALVELTGLRETIQPWLLGRATLIVHSDDANASVRLAGRDENLTGAGSLRYSLPAGEYLLVTSRPGRRPLEEQITVGRGEVRNFRVSRLPELVGEGPFVVLNDSGPARASATLTEAIAQAKAKATIEIRGDGPFVTAPIRVTRPLTIRSGAGFTPVIRHDGKDPLASLITAYQPLILEGLTLEMPGSGKKGLLTRLVHTLNTSVGVAGCRLQVRGNGAGLLTESASVVEVRRTLMLRGDTNHGMVEFYSWRPGGRALLDGCVLLDNDMGVLLLGKLPVGSPCRLVVRRSTLIAHRPFVIWENIPWTDRAPAKPHFNMEVSDSILKGTLAILHFNQQGKDGQLAADTPEASAWLRKMITYRDRGNAYSTPSGMLLLTHRWVALPAGSVASRLPQWSEFWGQQATDSYQVPVEFHGGDVGALAVKDVRSVLAEDLALEGNSPGKGGASDGKDLGADVNLLGPGKALERWRTTAEYQEWLKAAEQILNTRQEGS